MATYNNFKKHAMIFAKNKKQKIIITRENDCYYIADGFTMLKLPAVFYDVLLRPLSPLFLQLENRQKAIRRPGEELPEMDVAAADLANTFSRLECENPVNITDFIYDPIGNKNAAIRLAEINWQFYQYNDGYISAAMEYAGTFTASNDKFPALKYENEMGVGCLIMPINNSSCNNAIGNLREAMRK